MTSPLELMFGFNSGENRLWINSSVMMSLTLSLKMKSKAILKKQIQMDFSSFMHNKSLQRNVMTSSSVGSSSDLSSSWNTNSRYGVEINSRQSSISTADSDMSDMTFSILTQPLTLKSASLNAPSKSISRDVEKVSSHRTDKKNESRYN